jgi:hypothetical protein
MTINVELKDFFTSSVDASSAQITEKVKGMRKQSLTNSNIITKEDRESILKFAGMTKEQRQAYVNELNGASQPPEAVVPPEPEPKLPEIPATPPAAPAVPPAVEDKPQEAESVSEFLERISAQNEEIKKHRAANSRLGQQNDSLNKQLEKLLKDHEDLRKQLGEIAAEKAPKKPVRPKLPNPKDFEDGALDPKYHDKVNEYNAAIEQYDIQYEQYMDSKKPGYVTSLEEELRQVKPRVEEVVEYTTSTRNSQRQSEHERKWSDMWETAMAVQGDLGLKTSIPLKTINEQMTIVQNATAVDQNGNRIYSDAQVGAAQAFMTKLNVEDRKSYDNTVKLMSNLYRFDSSTPELYDSFFDPKKPEHRKVMLQNAALKAGVDLSSFGTYVQAPMSEAERMAELAKRQQNENSQAMPGSAVGASDPSVFNQKPKNEKISRLKELVAMAKGSPRLFKPGVPEYDQKLAEEYFKLRKELGVPA